MGHRSDSGSRQDDATSSNISNDLDGQRSSFQNAVVTAIIDASPLGILVVDDNAKIVTLNHRFLDIWQVPYELKDNQKSVKLEDVNDEPLLAEVASKLKDPEAFVSRVKELYDNPELNDYAELQLKDGRYLKRHSAALYSDSGDYLGRVWFLRDVTQEKQEEVTLTLQANSDPLTGVANRRFLQVKGREEFARAQRFDYPLSLIIIDVDHFKQINDNFGHASGDELLKALCKSILGAIRVDIDMLVRLGGDEFVVLLPSTDINGARIVANRLRTKVEELTVVHDDNQINCTITCGVSTLLKNDTSIEDLLSRADLALYKGKKQGRNFVA